MARKGRARSRSRSRSRGGSSRGIREIDTSGEGRAGQGRNPGLTLQVTTLGRSPPSVRCLTIVPSFVSLPLQSGCFVSSVGDTHTRRFEGAVWRVVSVVRFRSTFRSSRTADDKPPAPDSVADSLEAGFASRFLGLFKDQVYRACGVSPPARVAGQPTVGASLFGDLRIAESAFQTRHD
jgi:hypothetical protein